MSWSRYLWSTSKEWHYGDVVMGAMASQITSLTIVYWTVYSGADQRKYQSSASLAFVRGIHRWPAQRTSNAKNVSIWLRHRALEIGRCCVVIMVCPLIRPILWMPWYIRKHIYVHVHWWWKEFTNLKHNTVCKWQHLRDIYALPL